MHPYCSTVEEEAKLKELIAAKGEERAKVEWLTAKLTLKCRADFAYFCRTILGYQDMNAEHQALCEFLQHEAAQTRLILMPRYTFKSSIITIGHTLWLLLKDANERILLCSDAAEKAEGFLLGIKNHILGLTGDGGFRKLTVLRPWEVDPQRLPWNQSAIVVKARTQAQVEPSVDTSGLETSKVGMHYTRIKFDDLVTDKNVTTKDLLDKVEACYKKALSLLTPSGQVDIAGTRWHYGDLYGRLIDEYRGRDGFALFHRKAYEGDRYFFDDIGKDSLTPAFLAQKKATQGTRLFSCLYQNEPVDDETATFKAADFRFYQPLRNEQWERWRRTLYVTCVLDPIPPPTSDHGDDAAITVVGTDADHAMYLLEAVAGRLTPERQIEEVLSLHAVYTFRRFGLETNAFQKMLRPMLERRLAELRMAASFQPFSITEFSGITQGNKEQRIQGLQPWHERGLVRLPGESLNRLQGVYSQLAYQMINFPHSQKDDLLDSLAYHLQLKQAGRVATVAPTFPETSAAWYEREVWAKQQRAARARLPRWQRPPAPELAFS